MSEKDINSATFRPVDFPAHTFFDTERPMNIYQTVDVQASQEQNRQIISQTVQIESFPLTDKIPVVTLPANGNFTAFNDSRANHWVEKGNGELEHLEVVLSPVIDKVTSQVISDMFDYEAVPFRDRYTRLKKMLPYLTISPNYGLLLYQDDTLQFSLSPEMQMMIDEEKPYRLHFTDDDEPGYYEYDVEYLVTLDSGEEEPFATLTSGVVFQSLDATKLFTDVEEVLEQYGSFHDIARIAKPYIRTTSMYGITVNTES